jgi:hypothetical protein
MQKKYPINMKIVGMIAKRPSCEDEEMIMPKEHVATQP